ncbi:hypothetical protein ACLOAU_14560 [Niabella sp. CJ426]|uniref:hypothetical protein n=1 Tax=Niabella sp. CJ426 TaxID=3393740 RepID=UPI003CFD50A6
MNLLISFTDQSESFTYGVEFGRILAKIERGEDCIQNNGFPVRIENKQVIKSACDTYGYVPVFGSEDSGWISFMGVKKGSTEN